MTELIRSRRLVAPVVLCIAFLVPATRGAVVVEEGMWTFDNPPLQLLKERYGFVPTREWLDHLRLASVRLNDGGSGSFVSADGLLLTNHHVARGQIQKLSTPNRDLIKNGFYARTPADELTCPDLEMNVLMSMEDVTETVRRAAQGKASDHDALKARQATMARIEKDSQEQTGLRSEIVTLYHGGEYWLYRYKRYTDVRLVFAPEQQAAFFGGDPDNFTYPRHDLDFTIVRAYENEKPASTPHFLKWNTKGAGEDELVFVSGHPGETERLKTLAQLEFNRDHFYPWLFETFERRLKTLRKYGAAGPERARQTQDLIFNIENTVKAITGEFEGLKDAALMSAKRKDEQTFRARVDGNPEWKKLYGSAWDTIALVQEKKVADIGTAVYSMARLSSLALDVVRYARETARPDAERLEGFHDSQLESLRFRLLSPAPVYPEMDEMLLADAWAQLLERRGPDDPYINALLGGRPAAEIAREVTSQTKLGDPAFRKALIEGGPAAIAAATDPFVALARRVEPVLRQQTLRTEQAIAGPETAAQQLIGEARFAAFGKTVSPDATFTLRLTFGTVKGYPMNGTRAPFKTTFHGLYDRALGFGMQPPYEVPERLLERKDRIDMTTALNFVNTCDIIGGNSGSPVVNRNGELVGLIFDGNIESLVANFVYSPERGRAVAVHSAAIIEVLRKVYDAGELADVLEATVATSAR